MGELLSLRQLTVSVGLEPPKQILRGVSLSLGPGEILGVLGESGAGKSTILRAIAGILPEGFRLSGEVLLQGVDLLSLSQEELRRRRGRELAMVFQEPLRHLNPSRRAGKQLDRLIRLYHPELSKGESSSLRGRLLQEVGLPGTKRVLDSYPHELSGGMRQRLMIAMALTGDPALLLADEPTTALDYPLQGEIVSLLRRLAGQRRMGVVYVSHDLRALEGVSDRLLVLLDGEMQEEGRAEAVLSNPRAEYTRRLLRSAPGVASRGQSLLERGERR